MPVVSSHNNTKHKVSQPPPSDKRRTHDDARACMMMGTEQRTGREHVSLREISENRQTHEIFFDECVSNSYNCLSVSPLSWRFRKIFLKKCKILIKNDLTTKYAYLSSVTV